MSRYVNDIATSKSADEVEHALSDYFADKGFTRQTYKQEDVWKKGHGLLQAPQFVKATPTDNRVHIEAWIKFAPLPGVYVGETGIEAKVLPARLLKKRVQEIETLLT